MILNPSSKDFSLHCTNIAAIIAAHATNPEGIDNALTIYFEKTGSGVPETDGPSPGEERGRGVVLPKRVGDSEAGD